MNALYGWIRDLSAPDPTNLFNLFGLIPFDPTVIPVIGPFLHTSAFTRVFDALWGSGRS